MSPTKKGRKVRSNSGRNFQAGASGGRIGAAGFASAIADALRRDYGDSRSAIKKIAALTVANERAVKNWFEARNGPSGEFLIVLCRHSDQVLETVLTLAGRTKFVTAKKLVDAKGKLLEMLALIDKLEAP